MKEPPTLELKPLPNTLKYAYLCAKEILPVIIAANLSEIQEECLLFVLKENKEAIGWTMKNIKGDQSYNRAISYPSTEEAKPRRDPQRQMNLVMKEALKDILKCLDNGIIYPIFNSPWVNPIHVVPK